LRKVPKVQVLERIRRENPWWAEPHTVAEPYITWRPRPYIDFLFPLIQQTDVKRAVVLMGPRRVGKTVLLYHSIQKLIASGVNPERICYVSVDHPLFNGMGLEDYLTLFVEAGKIDAEKNSLFLFFDEIQYLKEWEVHLKSLVDSHPNIKVTVSGSAAAALRLKSSESGAGRFTNFLLPPLTFHEYLTLLGLDGIVTAPSTDGEWYTADNLDEFNRHFLHYLNFGGYPEVVFSERIQKDPGRFIKSDIIDKVLLRDLPSLYGIQDIQELNSLFTTLAFNTANEVSLEELSKGSGVAKNTIKRYIRANFFKVYLTNPSMRSALFSPVESDDSAVGSLVETGIFAQWFHSYAPLYYARWKGGEVDMVQMSQELKPEWALEVKWSDRIVSHPEELHGVIQFCKSHEIKNVVVTTKTIRTNGSIDGVPVEFIPAGEYCYTVGKNVVSGLKIPGKFWR
jgi:predicted AAA+ superfamily ATPase